MFKLTFAGSVVSDAEGTFEELVDVTPFSDRTETFMIEIGLPVVLSGAARMPVLIIIDRITMKKVKRWRVACISLLVGYEFYERRR